MNDDEMERELRLLAQLADPVPPRLIRAAQDAFAWRDVDAELARLVFDSLAAESGHAVRGGGVPRLLTFEGGGLTIELEVAAPGGLAGQLLPPQAARVEIRQPSGTRTVPADDGGRFTAGPLRRGPFSVRCRTEEGAEIATSWISL